MKKNILIYPSGAENAIEIYNSIKYSVHLNVFGASGKLDHSELIYENPIIYLPYIDDVDFVDQLNKAIETYNIDYIFPTHDTIANILSEKSGGIDCHVLSSPSETNQTARHKSKTYDIFSNDDFCPRVFGSVNEVDMFPMIIKPDVGEGARGVQLIEDFEELKACFNQNSVMVEYLPGKEYTIDCFTNSKGELLFCGARERAEIRMGISFLSKDADNEVQNEAKRIGEAINKKLKFNGLWFFQLKFDANNKLKLLEICTRTAGTMGFFRHKGINLPLLTIMDAMGMDVSITNDKDNIVLYRSTFNRIKYDFTYKSIYIDFDDTIIVNNQVNIQAISLIYQSKNRGIKVVLITKHEFDLIETLGRFAISTSLFDEIILLKADDEKFNYITETNSIFIDNWFKERQKVYDQLGIPVFDVDAIPSLIIN